MEVKALLRLRRTLLNIAGLHYSICLLLLVINGSFTWILIPLYYDPKTRVCLLVLFILNGLGFLLLIKFVKDLCLRALKTTKQMIRSRSREYRKLHSASHPTPTGTPSS